MSTKVTILHGKSFHLYRECETGEIHLEVRKETPLGPYAWQAADIELPKEAIEALIKWDGEGVPKEQTCDLRERLLAAIQQWGPGGCRGDIKAALGRNTDEPTLRDKLEKILDNWNRISGDPKCVGTERWTLVERSSELREILG